MKHITNESVVVPFLQQYYKQLVFALAAIFIASITLVSFSVSAASPLFSFTQSELDTNWGPERIAPSGGYSSLGSFEGRSNVAKININSTATSPAVYYRTEGIKNPKNTVENFSIGKDFGQSIQVDLYLDPAWDNNAIRAGLWTVGDNNAGGTDAANYPFGIIEFANVGGHEGFRYYDPSVGYVPISGFDQNTGYGKWVTLKIALDPMADRYVYSVDGVQVGFSESPAISTYLYSAILNQRNFGLDPQIGLTNNSYSVHWNGGVAKAVLSSIDDCKNNGWKTGVIENNTRIFRNQGDCVSYFATNTKNQPASDKKTSL
jgi:hypothetical protein